MQDHDDLIQRKYTVLATAVFGGYQGDLLFLIRDDTATDPQRQLGVIVTGYGSCSGCDELEAAHDAVRDGENPHALDELADALHRSAVFGTEHELKLYLLGPDAGLHYWFHEKDFEDAANTVFQDTIKSLGN